MRAEDHRTRQLLSGISPEAVSALLGEPPGTAGPALDFRPVPDESGADLGHRLWEGLVATPVAMDVLGVLEAKTVGDVSRSNELRNVQPPPHARAP